jgi:hypothetical protein
MALIKQNSYWILDGEGEDAKMNALCEMCAKKERKGWFWEGKVLGYGDYDLFCKSCKNAIYLRDNNAETTNKNQSK